MKFIPWKIERWYRRKILKEQIITVEMVDQFIAMVKQFPEILKK